MDEPTNVSDEEVLAYNRARVESLLQMVVAALPTAKACMSSDGSFGYVSASIEFSNGISVLVACDNDLPQALFEVVRFSSPLQPPLLAFEARATLGAAFSDKLTREGSVKLLQQYAAVPASQPGPDASTFG